MESNEQTELTHKTETDLQMESRLTASVGGEAGDGRTEQKAKTSHGHGQQCGNCWGEGHIRGLTSNRKNTMKIKLKKNKKSVSYIIFSVNGRVRFLFIKLYFILKF